MRSLWKPLLWAVWTVLGAELLLRGTVGGALAWGGGHPIRLLLSVLLVAAVGVLASAVTGLTRVFAALLSVGLLAVAFVSGTKLRILGVPLLVGDLGLAREAQGVTHLADLITWPLAVSVAVLLVVGGVLLYRWREPQRPGRQERLISGVVAGLLIAVIGLLPGAGLPRTLGPTQLVTSGGLVLSTVAQLQGLLPISRSRTAEAATLPVATAVSPSAVAPGADVVHPNIIVLLSESLWDLTKLPKVSYSTDPLPYLHELQRQFPGGTMLSPTFGGNTANAEFEILTGLSMQFLPPGGVVYTRQVNQPVDSLASILGRQGYRTAAITPWYNWFFNNNKAYRYLGFSRLITTEYMRPYLKGGTVSDDEVANLIIQESERGGPGPHFVFANTGQNHYPYDRAKYDNFEVKATGLSPAATDILEPYAQGCLDADRMLRKLTDHFTQTKQPTVIVFFGDHLPVLGNDFQVYREGGYISGTQDPDFLNKMYRPTTVIWDNYLPHRPESISFGMNQLAPYLLSRAGLQSTPLLDYVKSLRSKVPALPPQQYWPAWEIAQEDLATYKAAEEDILFGDQKTYGDLKAKIVDPNYVMGYGPITIDQAQAHGPADVTVTLTGQNLPPQGTVYLGETPVNTSWKADGQLEALIPQSAYKPGETQLQVRLLDSQKSVIARSNSVPVPAISN